MAVAQAGRLSDDNREIVPGCSAETAFEFARRVARTARAEFTLLAQMLGPFVFACAGVGLAVSRYWSGRKRGDRLIMFAALGSPIVLLPFLHLEERYLLSSALLLILLASAAFTSQRESCREGAGTDCLRIAAWLMAFAFVWMVCDLGIRGWQGFASRPKTVEQQWGPVLAAIRHEKDVRGRVMGPPVVAFYAGREALPMPWEPLNRVLDYGRTRGASFLIAGRPSHPEVAALVDTPVATRDLVPLARAEGGRLYLIRSAVAAGAPAKSRSAQRGPELPWSDPGPAAGGSGQAGQTGTGNRHP